MIGNAQVTMADVEASNGVVHVRDADSINARNVGTMLKPSRKMLEVLY
jgi:hypothetical protein